MSNENFEWAPEMLKKTADDLCVKLGVPIGSYKAFLDGIYLVYEPVGK